MTDLRRTARLIDDLHILGVLEKTDEISYFNDDGILIMIELLPEKLTGNIEKRLVTIQNSLKEEFPEKNFRFLLCQNAIICGLYKKE